MKQTHATNDSLEIQIEAVAEEQHAAHEERVKAASKAVVRKIDFEEFKAENNEQHKMLIVKLDKLAPLATLADEKTIKYLQEGVKLKQSTDITINSWKGKARTAAIFLGVIAVILTIVLQLKGLFIELYLKLR